MSDILYSAAIAYQKLENALYKIVIVRKGTKICSIVPLISTY